MRCGPAPRLGVFMGDSHLEKEAELKPPTLVTLLENESLRRGGVICILPTEAMA